MLTSTTPLKTESMQILRRMADVFGQAYQRFLDLQKAEAQAREAQIEAALERVRASSMAMHHSSELSEVAQVVFEQLAGLDLSVNQCWIDILSEEHDSVQTWATKFGGEFYPRHFSVPLSRSDF